MKTETNIEAIVGSIQVDRSGGQGHCWRIVTDLPGDILQEIEGEILDGGNESCPDYVASNGQHYRWGV